MKPPFLEKEEETKLIHFSPEMSCKLFASRFSEPKVTIQSHPRNASATSLERLGAQENVTLGSNH